jgi:hypothetical protein
MPSRLTAVAGFVRVSTDIGDVRVAVLREGGPG